MVKVKFRKILNRYFATVNVAGKQYKKISNKSLNVVCSELKKFLNYPLIAKELKQFREEINGK